MAISREIFLKKQMGEFYGTEETPSVVEVVEGVSGVDEWPIVENEITFLLSSYVEVPQNTMNGGHGVVKI